MKKIISCFVALFILGGCASSFPLGDRFSSAYPQPRSSLIYLYRPSNFFGSGVYYEVKENGQSIVTLYNGGYYPYYTMPGYKKITAGSSSVSFYAEAGHTYFIRGKEHMGLILYHPALKLVPEEKALREIQMCKIIEK